MVEEFPYLGSVIGIAGRIDADVERRIAQPSRVFGALRKAVFSNKDLSLRTKGRSLKLVCCQYEFYCIVLKTGHGFLSKST